jgi:hypothetical protein
MPHAPPFPSYVDASGRVLGFYRAFVKTYDDVRYSAATTRDKRDVRVTAKKPVHTRPGVWITVVTALVVISFLTIAVTNGSIIGRGTDDQTDTTGTTLVSRPVLPIDGTETTTPGVQARCKDGTYYFSGNASTPDDQLCKDNGGVDKRL